LVGSLEKLLEGHSGLNWALGLYLHGFLALGNRQEQRVDLHLFGKCAHRNLQGLSLADDEVVKEPVLSPLEGQIKLFELKVRHLLNFLHTDFTSQMHLELKPLSIPATLSFYSTIFRFSSSSLDFNSPSRPLSRLISGQSEQL
jgi:hypothetical protein